MLKVLQSLVGLQLVEHNEAPSTHLWQNMLPKIQLHHSIDSSLAIKFDLISWA